MNMLMNFRNLSTKEFMYWVATNKFCQFSRFNKADLQMFRAMCRKTSAGKVFDLVSAQMDEEMFNNIVNYFREEINREQREELTEVLSEVASTEDAEEDTEEDTEEDVTIESNSAQAVVVDTEEIMFDVYATEVEEEVSLSSAEVAEIFGNVESVVEINNNHMEGIVMENSKVVAGVVEEVVAGVVVSEGSANADNNNFKGENVMGNQVIGNEEVRINEAVRSAVTKSDEKAEQIVNDVIDGLLNDGIETEEEDVAATSIDDATEKDVEKWTEKVHDALDILKDHIGSLNGDLKRISKLSYREGYEEIRRHVTRWLKTVGTVKAYVWVRKTVVKAFGFIKNLLVSLVRRVAKEKAEEVFAAIKKIFDTVGAIIKVVAEVVGDGLIITGLVVVKASYALGGFAISATKALKKKWDAKKVNTAEAK